MFIFIHIYIYIYIYIYIHIYIYAHILLVFTSKNQEPEFFGSSLGSCLPFRAVFFSWAGASVFEAPESVPGAFQGGFFNPRHINLHQFVAEIPVPMPIFISGRSAQNCVMAKRPRAIAGLGAAPQRKDNGWSWDLTPKTKNGQRMFFGHQTSFRKFPIQWTPMDGWSIQLLLSHPRPRGAFPQDLRKRSKFFFRSTPVPSLNLRKLFQAVSMDCLRKIQALPMLSDFRGIRITGQSSDEAEALGFRVDFFPEYAVGVQRAFVLVPCQDHVPH